MPKSRPSLKQLSFSLILLMLKILSEQMALAASDAIDVTKIQKIMPDESVLSLDPDELTYMVGRFYAVKAYDQLLNLLAMWGTPENERHRFEVIINYLKDPKLVWAQKPSIPLIQSCYFVEEFQPSTTIGQIIKDALTQGIREQIQDFNLGLLDYHVMKGDYEKAARYLDDNHLPKHYREAFNRLAAREQDIEKLNRASVISLLQQNQLMPKHLTYTHPVFRSELGEISPKRMLHNAEIGLYTPSEVSALNARPASNLGEILQKDAGTYSIQDINSLTLALREKDNPYVKHNRGKILASLVLDKIDPLETKKQYREIIKQLLIVNTFDGIPVVPNIHKSLYNLLIFSSVPIEPDEELLLLRYLLANANELNPQQKEECKNRYQKRILSYEHQSDTPLLHFYDAFDGKFIRDLYEKNIANQIIKKEKSLAKPSSQLTLAVKAVMQRLDEIMPFNVTGVQFLLGITISLIYTITRHLMDRTDDPKNDKVKTKTSPVATRKKKSTKKPKEFVSSKTIVYTLESVEQTENTISPLSAHPLEEAHPEPLAPAARIIQPVTLTVQEKIDKLLQNEKFPPQKRPSWVKLPSMTLDELEYTTKAHANDPYIKTQMRLLEGLNAELISDKIKLDHLQEDYARLVHAYDSTLNPSDVDLKEYEEKIRYSQLEAGDIITTIQTKADSFMETTRHIETKIKQLTKSKSAAPESKEERSARIARLKADKIAKKIAKQEEVERAAKIAEANERRAAEHAAENQERLHRALLTRLMEPEQAIKEHFRYAHNALLILKDIVDADAKDTPYLRDACILSCTQLYEALSKISVSPIFESILPNSNLLSREAR